MHSIFGLTEKYYPEYPGGAGKLAWETFSSLASRGHHVEVFTPTSCPDRTELVDNVRVHRMQCQLKHTGFDQQEVSRAIGWISKRLNIANFDIIHDLGGFLFQDIAPHFSLKYRKPLITHLLLLMGPYAVAERMGPEFTRNIHERQAQSCRASDLTIVTSRSDQRLFDLWFDESPPPAVLANGARIPTPLSPERRLELQKRFGLTDRVGIFLGGRLSSFAKGLDIAVNMLRDVLANHPQVCLVLTGELGTKAALLDSLPRQSVMPLGWIPHSQVSELQACCDYVVLTPRYEAFGLAVLESMLHGCVPLVLNVGGLVDLVEHGVSGFVFDLHAPDAMSSQLAIIEENPFEKAKLRDAARKRAQSFGIDILATQLEDVYKRLIRKNATDCTDPSFQPA